MTKLKKFILCNFLLVCGVQQCLTSDTTFQNATVFCKTFTNILQSFFDELHNSANDSCTSDGYKLVIVTGTVTTIYENVVTDFSNLNGLNFTEVGLQEIQPGAFKNFPDLDVLAINNNHLNEIRSGVFDDLRLSYLFLHNNSISILDGKAFHNLQNLNMLSLESNNLKTIRKGVFDNISLWMLNLRNNQIEEIEAGAFDNIHPESSKWKILIYLSNNNLKEINADVFNIEQLITLNLDNNSISEIRPGDLENLPNLRDLSLSGNKIKVIPNGIFSGLNIEKLDLSHNQISAIESQAFDEMEHLLEVKINNNKLRLWNSDWFSASWSSGFSKFRKLDVSFNNIGEIPDNAFQNCGNNNFIVNLQWNRITKISNSAFNGLTYVNLLDLSHNEISEWSENLLNHVKVIGTVDLSDNEFKCRDIDSKSVFVPRARKVILHDCVQFDKE